MRTKFITKQVSESITDAEQIFLQYTINEECINQFYERYLPDAHHFLDHGLL
jgi:hypothetical protein